MIPAVINDYIAQGLALFTSQFQNAPQLQAWTASYLAQANELEAALWDAFYGRMLATATIYTLPQTNTAFDTLGALVGQERLGQDDQNYKSLIYLRVAVNRGGARDGGDWSNYAAILLQTSGGPAFYFESGTGATGLASAFFFGMWGMTLNPPIVATLLAEAVPDGEGPNCFAWSTWHDGDDFALGTIYGTPLTNLGWGSVYDSSAGGLLVAASQI